MPFVLTQKATFFSIVIIMAENFKQQEMGG